jgi:transposase
MIYVGIDAAKDRHDCRILGGNGQLVQETFTFRNYRQGFEQLMTAIQIGSEAGGFRTNKSRT